MPCTKRYSCLKQCISSNTGKFAEMRSPSPGIPKRLAPAMQLTLRRAYQRRMMNHLFLALALLLGARPGNDRAGGARPRGGGGGLDQHGVVVAVLGLGAAGALVQLLHEVGADGAALLLPPGLLSSGLPLQLVDALLEQLVLGDLGRVLEDGLAPAGSEGVGL